MHALLMDHALVLHGLTRWLSPDYLVGRFGVALFWLGIVLLFVECGLLWPFLPGDTLLFAIGLFIADGRVRIVPGPRALDLAICLVVYAAASFLGNVVGYGIGARLGPRIHRWDNRLLSHESLERTSAFFERRGSLSLVIGRFVPVVRTYITLMAGVSRMDRRRFLLWSLVGAALWVASITLAGALLGGTFPSIGHRIDDVTYGLLVLTGLGYVAERLRQRWRRQSAPERESSRHGSLSEHRRPADTV